MKLEEKTKPAHALGSAKHMNAMATQMPAVQEACWALARMQCIRDVFNPTW